MNISSFDDVLAMNLSENTPGFGAAQKVLKDNYSKIISFQNVRTYSTTDLLYQCPRKYSLKKLQAEAGTQDRINSPTFAFGHAVGAGVAVYDKTRDLDQAVWAAFLAWDIDLLEAERKVARKGGKSFVEAVWALYAYEDHYHNNSIIRDYEVKEIEATLAVDFEDGHYYSGHVDELLVHRESGRYLVKENKTDGGTTIDPAKYSNSDQALSYSIIVDMMGAQSYTVLYCVYSTQEQRWLEFEFVKSVAVKAEWIQDQLLTNQQIDDYGQLNFFPKRGRNCMAYNRRCEYYETCDFSATKSFKPFNELPKLTSFDQLEELEAITFRTTLSEIVARQKASINTGVLSNKESS